MRYNRDRDRFGFTLQGRMDYSRPVDHAGSMMESIPVIEIMKHSDHYSRHGERYRIVRNGYIGLAGKEALSAIETVLNRMLYDSRSDGAFNEARDRIRWMLNLAYGNKVNLKQIADDKAWPIFWASLLIDDDFMDGMGYTRDNAREKIDIFCSYLRLTKKDWAWMCNQEPYYLYCLFSMPVDLIHIRWPERFMVNVRSDIHFSRPFGDWLKAYFITHDGAAIDPMEFQMICRDVLDAEQSGLDLAKVYRAATWEDFCRRLHAVEGRRIPYYGGSGGHGVYGRSPIMGALDHARLGYDMAAMQMVNFVLPPRGQMSRRPSPDNEHAMMMYMNDIMIHGGGMVNIGVDESKPTTIEPLEWMADLPTEINFTGGLRAVLLRDNIAVWEEANTMKHCLYRNYLSKMRAKDYVAYHITAPHLAEDHKGFTLGFSRGFKFTRPPGYMTATEILALQGMSPEQRLQHINRNVNPPLIEEKDTGWTMDQIRGYKNSFNKDTAVDAFVTFIGENLNKVKS